MASNTRHPPRKTSQVKKALLIPAALAALVPPLAACGGSDSADVADGGGGAATTTSGGLVPAAQAHAEAIPTIQVGETHTFDGGWTATVGSITKHVEPTDVRHGHMLDVGLRTEN